MFLSLLLFFTRLKAMNFFQVHAPCIDVKLYLRVKFRFTIIYSSVALDLLHRMLNFLYLIFALFLYQYIPKLKQKKNGSFVLYLSHVCFFEEEKCTRGCTRICTGGNHWNSGSRHAVSCAMGASAADFSYLLFGWLGSQMH